MDQKEKQILRAAVEELQVEGDDKLLIGKLHHHILALQVSEATALRKLEVGRSKCLRLETALLNAERAIEEKENTVVDLRSRVYGQVTLTSMSIDARRSSLEKSLAVLEEEKQELQGKLAEADFKLDSQDELRDAAAQNTIDDYLGRISAMEEDIVKIQIKSDRRELEWDKRQEDLERKLGTLEDEREVVLRSSATAEVKAIVLDRSMPLSKQLESSLRLLSEKSQLASAQEMKIAHLEAEVSTLSKKLEDAIRRTVAKDSHINELRQTVATRDLREVDIEEKIDVRTRNLYSDREAEAMHRAQEVIMSLQKQLRKKEELVDKYRDMIKSIRRETHSQTNAEKAGKEELTELINEMNDKNVANLQKPRDVKVIPMEQSRSILAQLLKNLKKSSKQKKKRLQAPRSSRNPAVRMELEDRKKTEEKLERLIEQLRGEVTQSMMDLRPVADMEAEAEAAKLLREQVVRLRRDVEKKDSRIMAMGKALAKMEDAMVKNAEETTEIQIRRARIGPQETINRGLGILKANWTGEIDAFPKYCRSHYIRATKTVETLRRQCTEKDESYSKLRSEFGNLERQFSMQSEIHKRTHKALKESEFKLKKLNERYSTENLSKKSGGDGRSMATQTPEDMFRQKVERSASDLSREQWEVEKRLEKRIQDLRSKLTDKVKENEDMRKAEATLRDTLERTERDRARLQQKVAALSDKRRPNRSTESLRRQPHDSSSSHRISGVGMPGDYETGEDFDYRAEPGERSRKLVLVLESRVRDLMQRIHVLDGEKVRVESDVLAAKFEKEKAIANAERLERRAAELEKSLEELQRLDEERNEHIMSNGIPGLNVSLGQIRVATTRLLANKSHDEIVAVVDHLSKSMERLKYENDSLKKSGASNIKYMEMLKELKILRKEKVIMADLERARAAAAVQVNKVEAENQRLRRQAKKESDKAARATAYVQELELMKEGLVNEVAMLKNAEDGQGPDCGGFGGADMQNTLKKYSEEVARLKGQLAERDVMIANLRSTEGTTPQMAEEIRKLRRESDVWKARASKATRDLSGVLEPRDVVSDSEDPNGGLELDSRAADYVEGLREENQDLKAKLAQFDNGFMDEVEDLKSSYKDIVKRNLYYEEHIRNLCRMSGMSSERILNVEPSHERRAEF
ncbi:hypothetical protein BC829DRAFT_418071 [Chytridium lagenaria]|nr:hypothetical protein BC829DRAFT_418071 [Chytridium lagenaria]